MKLHVIFNNDGDIVAAVQLAPDASLVRARPMADEHAGQRAADVDVPTEHQHHDLAALCQTMKVDDNGKSIGLKAKD
jgi:hypothetical protein